MKSKYGLILFLIGVLPVLGVVGVYTWMTMNEAPLPQSSRNVDIKAFQVAVPAIQTDNQTIANSLKAAIERTYMDLPKLVANNSEKDLDDFVKSHGLSGVAVLSFDGTLIKSVPATAQVADPAYGTSEEFQKMVLKFKESAAETYLFFTQRFGYPAFVFAIPLDSAKLVQGVLNLAVFFQGYGTKGGEIYLFDAESGQYFFHSNPAKLQTTFNPNQEKWLSKMQAAIVNKQIGSMISDDGTLDAVYTPVGIKAFAIVHIIPMASLQPPTQGSTHTKSPIEDLQGIFQTPTGMALLIAAAGALGWIFIMGFIGSGMIFNPLRKAGALVLNAAKGSATLSPESARAFGHDEVGQMVQATAMLMQKMNEEKKKTEEDEEQAMRAAHTEVENKSKEAASQVAAAQQQAQAAKNELSEKNQQLNDKLKELDALKSMSEGLRNQAEQAKTEVGKLKAQVASDEEAKKGLETKLTQTQSQLESRLKEMEAKLLSTVAASSAIHVSSVRAAAIRTMAEELKTTLGIIKGYVSSALGTAQGGINEKQQEFLGMVINRSARLEKFINDLLDIYQVEIELDTAPHEEVNLPSEIRAWPSTSRPRPK